MNKPICRSPQMAEQFTTVIWISKSVGNLSRYGRQTREVDVQLGYSYGGRRHPKLPFITVKGTV